MPTDWVIAGLVVVAAIAVAFAFPLGSLVRLGIVILGVLLGFGAIRLGLPERRIVSDLIAGASEDATQPVAQARISDQVAVTYHVTATVRVNGELRSGSSLQKGIISRNWLPTDQRLATTTRILGEAVAVPITDHTHLLFTMHAASGNRSYEEVITSPCSNIFEYSGPERPTADAVLDNAANFTGPCDVSLDRLPRMLAVTRSLEPVDFELVTSSTMMDVFGVPVEFVSLSFSRTDEPLRLHLAETFPWLKAALARKVNMPVPLKTNSEVSSFYISHISTGSEE